jgi:hypothetical protein
MNDYRKKETRRPLFSGIELEQIRSSFLYASVFGLFMAGISYYDAEPNKCEKPRVVECAPLERMINNYVYPQK